MISVCPTQRGFCRTILNNMNDAIENAKDSVIFAVMGLEKAVRR
jgi:hypothetical protein